MSWYGTSPWPALDGERKLAIGSAMMYLSNARILANLIFSGVLERHPDVKFVSVESGIGWIPFFLESLDYQLYESSPTVVDELSMLPSEYFKRQVYGCFWFEHRMLEPVIDALGASQILFETDFPHPTCLYPDPLASAAKALEGVSDDVRRQVLQDNAAALYKVELPAPV
jgi:predicted TIM-barrel fold metal-dependent hydrolase